MGVQLFQLLEINAVYMMVMKFHFIHFRVANMIMFCGIWVKLHCKEIELKCVNIDFQIGLV